MASLTGILLKQADNFIRDAFVDRSELPKCHVL